jgi:uncharacterized protein
VLSHFDLGGAQAARLISRALGAALLVTSLALIFRPWLIAYYTAHISEPSPSRTSLLTVLTGGFLGLLVSISSVGAGALGVTALIMLYPRLPTPRIVGSDIAHAVPLTLIAGIGHWIIRSVDLSVLGSLLAGSIPGVIVGSYAALRIADTGLRLVLATVLVVVGARLLS